MEHWGKKRKASQAEMLKVKAEETGQVGCHRELMTVLRIWDL